MVRRRRPDTDGLNLPAHLRVEAVLPDPLRWRSERVEWAKQHEWPPGKIGFLAFFQETREAYLKALGRW